MLVQGGKVFNWVSASYEWLFWVWIVIQGENKPTRGTMGEGSLGEVFMALWIETYEGGFQ